MEDAGFFVLIASGRPALLWGHPAGGTRRAEPEVDDDRGDYLGRAAAGADQFWAVVVAVRARRHLEHHVAVTDDTAHFAIRHGWLLFAGRWNYPNVIQTLPRKCGIAEH
jgi:hypothetical protein